MFLQKEKIKIISTTEDDPEIAVLAQDYREKCTECGSCFIACEEDAIDFTYPPAGTGANRSHLR